MDLHILFVHRGISMHAENQTFTLADGRALGFAEYGNPNGKPLFYFHGHPGSRFEARYLENSETARIIGVDRPGLGLSTYKAGRKILDWPDDIAELANSLGIARFAVAGFSGGGPYALACAYTRTGHKLHARLE